MHGLPLGSPLNPLSPLPAALLLTPHVPDRHRRDWPAHPAAPVSSRPSPTGTDGTGQSILLQLPQLEEAGWDVWTLYIPVEVRAHICTFRHCNA